MMYRDDKNYVSFNKLYYIKETDLSFVDVYYRGELLEVIMKKSSDDKWSFMYRGVNVFGIPIYYEFNDLDEAKN